ncbi:MAG: hypothetical protein P4L40_01640, partial [Terracidiphilus sp.]|nr:hypothetical protein [Terracidiphilus sp.]
MYRARAHVLRHLARCDDTARPILAALPPPQELKGQSCCICMCDYDDELEDADSDPVVRLSKCAGHYLHKACAVNAFQHSVKCPLCLRIYGVLLGNQPPGVMSIQLQPSRLPGYR